MLDKIKIFPTEESTKSAEPLMKEVVRLNQFPETARFNPYLSRPKAVKSAKEYVWDGDSFVLSEVSTAKRHNYKTGKTRLSDSFIAGIFAEIFKLYGHEDFVAQWDLYLEDYIKGFTAGDPVEVAHILNLGFTRFDPVEVPNHLKLLQMKILDMWEADLKSSDTSFSKSLDALVSDLDNHTRTKLRKSAGMDYNALYRRVKLTRCWDYRDAEFLVLICVATGTHPLRLLNWIGLYMTHVTGQPEVFKKQNPSTQPHEVELRNYNKECVGYEIAKRQFPESLILQYVKLIRGISFFDGSGQFKELLTPDFEFLMGCLILNEFTEIESIQWQCVTDAESCKQAVSYYSDCGMNQPNDIASRQVTELSEERMKTKAIYSAREKVMKATTGNPLFDRELLEG